jgi:glycerol uptake facilitator-like aquaporin
LAHAMFGEPLLVVGTHIRAGAGQWLSEVVATFGLVAVILGGISSQRSAVPWLVGLYITAAYWFTSSTSFANPAVTLARGFTTTFAGIRLSDVPGFMAAQAIGAVLGGAAMWWLWRGKAGTLEETRAAAALRDGVEDHRT